MAISALLYSSKENSEMLNQTRIAPIGITNKLTNRSAIARDNRKYKMIVNCSMLAIEIRVIPCHVLQYAQEGVLTLYTQARYKNKNPPHLHRDHVFPNFDFYRKDKYKNISQTTWGSGNEKQGYTYAVGAFGWLYGMYGIKSELLLPYKAAAADVLALASIEVDISNIPPGQCASYKLQGKPLLIKHRTANEIEIEGRTAISALKDPQTPEQRTLNQEWLVVIGICTHLGCVLVPNSGDWVGGFYCPCHGCHNDNVGRIRKGPAPTNLE
ncbi:unnamed protein product, partial [Leptidea sinapis]